MLGRCIVPCFKVSMQDANHGALWQQLGFGCVVKMFSDIFTTEDQKMWRERAKTLPAAIEMWLEFSEAFLRWGLLSELSYKSQIGSPVASPAPVRPPDQSTGQILC
jgi:hypothetical protein